MRRTSPTSPTSMAWWIAALLLLLTAGAGAADEQAGVEANALIALGKRVEARVSKLRGLPVREPVRWAVADKQHVRAYLKKTLNEQYAPGEMKHEGLALRALGLIPADLDYESYMLALYEEQVGGYYDPKEKTFYLAAWIAPAMQETIIAHELTHALQDQYFDLNRFVERERGNSDAMLARASLVEGGATMVMMLDSMRHSGLEVDPSMIDLDGPLGALMMGMSAAQFPEFAKAPRALREMMMFPYLKGFAFVAQGRKRGGWKRVDEIYADLPASTEQILHPEKYFGQRDMPQDVKGEALSALIPAGWQEIYQDVLGEFMTAEMLDPLSDRDEEKRAASGWDGDRYVVYQQGDRLAWFGLSVWDGDADAIQFAGAMAKTVARRYPDHALQALSDQPRLVYRAADGNTVQVARMGSWVLTSAGFDEAVSDALWAKARQSTEKP